MQAIYKQDGTITDVYDETLHRHEGLPTIDLTDEQAENIDLYRVNPSDETLYLVPTCDAKYIKTIDNVLIEMTQEEKDFLDVPSEYKKWVDGVQVEMTDAEKIAVKKTSLTSELTSYAKSFLSTAMAAYSEWEAISWPMLIAEAEQFQADGTVGEYMTAELGGKYKTAADLAIILLTRKEVMKQLRAGVVLVRQAKEAQIESAETFEDLAAVEIRTGWPGQE